MADKHTPGPFEVQDPMGSADGLWVVQAGLVASEWSCIAIVCRDEDRSGAHFITKAEQAANARLFAAAPDLLEALKVAFDYFPTEGAHFDKSSVVGAIHAAIAKAEGFQP
jgi:hypothetical protein